MLEKKTLKENVFFLLLRSSPKNHSKIAGRHTSSQDPQVMPEAGFPPIRFCTNSVRMSQEPIVIGVSIPPSQFYKSAKT